MWAQLTSRRWQSGVWEVQRSLPAGGWCPWPCGQGSRRAELSRSLLSPAMLHIYIQSCNLCLRSYLKFMYWAVSSVLTIPDRLGATSARAEGSPETFPKLPCWAKGHFPSYSLAVPTIQPQASFIAGSWKQAPEIHKSSLKSVRLYQVINFRIFN